MASTKWRILVDNVQGGVGHSNVAIAEMEYRVTAGGADQATGGTATASGDIGAGFTADKAFDDTNSTMWNSATPIGAWLQYEFASALDIVEYTVRARHDGFLNDSPVSWRLQYWNGSTWVTADTVEAIAGQAAWTASEQRTYAIGAIATKVRWRLLVDLAQGGSGHGNVAVAEMEYFIGGGSTDQTTGGTAAASGSIGAGFEASKAFDDTNTTMWNSGTPIGAWLRYDFGSAKDITGYSIRARHDGSLDDSPVSWRIQYYDGAIWVTAFAVTGEPNWSLSEIRTYGTFGGAAGPVLIIVT